MSTEKKKVRRVIHEHRIVYICPKCGKPIEFKKRLTKSTCKRCGQNLNWDDCEDISSVYLLAEDSNEAGYWASKYEEINGTTYGIDVEDWRLTRREYPVLLYFPFLSNKDYGRFMRLASKDGNVIKDICKGETE